MISETRHKYKTITLQVAVGLILLTILGFLVYILFGHAIIEVAYKSNATIVDTIMPGKAVTPLKNYYEFADDLAYTTVMAVIVPLLLAIAVVLEPAGTIVAIFSSASFFFIAEIGLRSVYNDVTTTGDNRSYLARRWHKTVRKNALGFRDRDFTSEKRQGIYRIAVIGDSITWGQGIAEEDRFSNRIERRLKQTTTAYEVLNFGKPGAQTDEELEILKRQVLPLKPDFVLLQWFTNDVQSSSKPLISPRSGMRLIPSKMLSRQLRKHSLMFWLLESEWITLQQTLGLKMPSEELWLARFGDPQGVAWTEAQETLRKFINSCKAHDVPLGIVLFSVSDFRESKLDFITDRVLQICEKTLTPCLDLHEVFAPFKSDIRLWVNRLDPHPSAFANSIAARALMKKFGEIWLGNAILTGAG